MATQFAGRQYTTQSSTTSTVTDGNRTTVTEVTTIDTTLGTAVVDVQNIANMRELDINFVSYKLRPNRQHHYYFDNKDMSHFVARPNIIVLDSKNAGSWPSVLRPPRLKLDIVGGNSNILLAESDIVTGNAVLYVTALQAPKSNVRVGNTVTVFRTSGLTSPTTTLVARGNVVAYYHYSGKLRDPSTTSSLTLAIDAPSTDNYYNGNVITIVKGIAAGQSANITSYNGITKVATISPALSTISSNSIYSIGDPRSRYASNTKQAHWTTNKGYAMGTLHIPNPAANTMFSFNTGDRLFRILDNPRNDITDYTSRSEYVFHSNGLKVDTAQFINRTVISNTTITDTDVILVPPKLTLTTAHDPIAQTFYVDELDYPEGIFVSSIDLFFKNKSDWTGVEVQLRPVVNGQPSSKDVLPNASVFLDDNDIRVSDRPNVSNALTATKFSFPAPVYLNSRQEYAFVVLSDDYSYDIYVSEVGEEAITGKGGRVSRQPFLGSMFKSQNGNTWTPLQDEDVMFVINKCRFDTSGTVRFSEDKGDDIPLPFGATANTYQPNAVYDLFQVHSDAVELPGTTINYFYRGRANSTGALDDAYLELIPDENEILDQQKIVYGPGIPTQSFLMQAEMSTENPDVSPIIFQERQEMVPQKMIINNLEITNTIITIVDGGAGYTNANTTLSFVGLTGGGATANITTNATGAIESVIMNSVGSGYYDNVTCIITTTDSPSAPAEIVVSSETDSSGGPAIARYISKTVVLSNGLSAGDFRVFVTASKPRASEVTVYYKVRNALDPEPMEEKIWTKMIQVGNEFTYSTLPLLEPIEFEYRPSLTSNNITYASTAADGGVYKTFNEFKVKVVLSSTSSLAPDIPSLFDLRAIALPEDIY